MPTNLETELQTTVEKLKEQIARYALKLENRNEELKELAYYDNLTGLVSRCIFYKNITQKISESERHKEIFGILYLDIDHFKKFNDVHGHHLGDNMLIQFTKRLKKLLRESDIISHLGGDEFAVMLTRLDDIKDCAVVAQKVIDVMQEPFDLGDGINIEKTVSIGISTYPSSATTAEELLKTANTAVYKAKERGRNTFQHYSEELDLNARKRLEIENDLRKALREGNQFILHYQPIYDAQSSIIAGAEALIRWNHPTLGLVSPYHFIPIAEKSGMIVPIGEWVLEEACRQCAIWLRHGLNVSVAVNIAAKQFKKHDLPELVQKYIYQSGIEPENLMLEITEGTLIDDVKRCKEMLCSLKDVGVQISIDDFGTGYSSLAYLKKFPLDKLKIDKSFIDDITNGEKDENIVKYTVDLGHNLNLKVVAEGVEDKEQFEILQNMNCDQIQGYYFSKPLTGHDFQDLALEEKKNIRS